MKFVFGENLTLFLVSHETDILWYETSKSTKFENENEEEKIVPPCLYTNFRLSKISEFCGVVLNQWIPWIPHNTAKNLASWFRENPKPKQYYYEHYEPELILGH